MNKTVNMVNTLGTGFMMTLTLIGMFVVLCIG